MICLTIGLFVFTGVPVQAEIKGKPVEGEVYEEVRTKEVRLYNNRSINISEEKLEVKEKIDEMSNYKMLQPKTESNIVKSDGRQISLFFCFNVLSNNEIKTNIE